MQDYHQLTAGRFGRPSQFLEVATRRNLSVWVSSLLEGNRRSRLRRRSSQGKLT